MTPLKVPINVIMKVTIDAQNEKCNVCLLTRMILGLLIAAS